MGRKLKFIISKKKHDRFISVCEGDHVLLEEREYGLLRICILQRKYNDDIKISEMIINRVEGKD
jgi:translation initiation factor IF-1